MLGDEVMAAALIDRLLHHCHIVSIRGNSYRLRHQRALWRPPEAEPVARSPAPSSAATVEVVPTS